jgi:hypothetical protein
MARMEETQAGGGLDSFLLERRKMHLPQRLTNRLGSARRAYSLGAWLQVPLLLSAKGEDRARSAQPSDGERMGKFRPQ